MRVNNEVKTQELVISLTISDEEEPNVDRSFDERTTRTQETKKRKCNEEEEAGSGVIIDLCYSSSDEFRVLSDLSGFPNLAQMIAAEAFIRKSKMKKRRKKKKKRRKIEFEAQEETVDAGKEERVEGVETSEVLETESVLVSENEVPQKLFVDAGKEEEQSDACKTIETTKACETGDGVRSAKVINLCLLSSDEDEVLADLSNSRGSGEMFPTEVIIRKKKKRKKRKGKKIEGQEETVDTVKEGEQPDTVKGEEITKALETELVPITENIVPQQLFVDSGKEEVQEDTVKHVEISKALETELVLVDAGKEEEQADTCKAVETTKECEAGGGVWFAEVIDLCLSSSEEDEVIADLSNSRGSGEILPIEVIIRKKKKRGKRRKEKRIEAQEKTEEMQGDTCKDVERVMSLETESVEIKDNIVLRKLLRGPRYFDAPESNWGMCYDCGEGHTAVNCTAQKQKKPCFVCGGLEHSGKHCKQGHDCFICNLRGHIAKDCPEKYQGNYLSSKICLRCGDLGHDMLLCGNDYSPDDLKEIQCYVCKAFGHLCCADFVDVGPRQVSCYNCGQSGHLGSGCTKSRRDISGSQSPALCYKCGEEGHFARRCIQFAKAGQKMGDLSTPTQGLPEEKKDILGFKSTPHDLYKAHNKKKTQYEERVIMTGGQSTWRDGWNTNKPRNLFYREARANVWLSPAASAKKSHEISVLTTYGHFSSPQYPQGKLNHHPGTPSSQAYQPGFSASRFGNPSSSDV